MQYTIEWLLPHSPMIHPDNSTSKTGIVSDASAEFQGKSLNNEALPGPKLHGDMFTILVRLGKELVVG